MVPGDEYSPNPLYRKDLLTGEIVRVDSLSDGSTFSANWGIQNATLSLDGNVAVFRSLDSRFKGEDPVPGGEKLIFIIKI